MITFAGASSENINKYLRYTLDNKSNISNNNQKLGIQFYAEFPFNVNTVLIRTTQNNKKRTNWQIKRSKRSQMGPIGRLLFYNQEFQAGYTTIKIISFKDLLRLVEMNYGVIDHYA